jgi:septum formation protein
VVDVDGSVLGKPGDDREAAAMLKALSGRAHEVHTGIAVVSPAGVLNAAVETTQVFFRPLSEDEINAYVATREPHDKAGAYGIQGLGGLLVERIEGSYDNVMGLPVTRLITLLREIA